MLIKASMHSTKKNLSLLGQFRSVLSKDNGGPGSEDPGQLRGLLRLELLGLFRELLTRRRPSDGIRTYIGNGPRAETATAGYLTFFCATNAKCLLDAGNRVAELPPSNSLPWPHLGIGVYVLLSRWLAGTGVEDNTITCLRCSNPSAK
ncbi:hypothetical protein CH63R_04288 [Colletotrichum higginsianum IMI 349063]|uniref:Uncharacterized protein n=1 Tax=Colletotrichum higginsianum (strain IMI 349063) TaxID=759273 RepID=A0A1B7YJ49_COLHI|nr:hypothetical protein CH63R_04288 [Colletotrichum higginsianum IMI 349063]OBR11992.1 hypothetical protein CH63R_04288 [Colletotrichum higginsianum IMI 349063]